MSVTVVLGGNYFTDCDAVIQVRSSALLRVRANPLRVSLETPADTAHPLKIVENVPPPDEPTLRSLRVLTHDKGMKIFWDMHLILVATEFFADTIHVQLDLRPLGLKIFDDVAGLHIGEALISGNRIVGAAAAIVAA